MLGKRTTILNLNVVVCPHVPSRRLSIVIKCLNMFIATEISL